MFLAEECKTSLRYYDSLELLVFKLSSPFLYSKDYEETKEMTKSPNQCPRCNGYETKILRVVKNKVSRACIVCKHVWTYTTKGK